MARYEAAIKSVSPLVMHSTRLLDPFDPITKEYKELTRKQARTRTESETEQIARLEFFAKMYYDPEIGPYMPGVNLEAMIRDGATKARKGMTVVRGVIVEQDRAPVQYKGPRDIDKMWADANFRLYVPSDLGDKRTVMTMRPIFREWSLKFSMLIDPDMIDPSAVETAIQVGGKEKALGDWRPKHGRFTLESWSELEDR